MRFQAFEVWLHPIVAARKVIRAETGISVSANAALDALMHELYQQWPALCLDALESSLAYPPLADNVRIFVYESPEGLFQLTAQHDDANDCLTFALRFAYCNPRSIYHPFCAMVSWLMRRYNLLCHVVSGLAPSQEGLSKEITDPEKVCDVLTASMDYNRRLWQLDTHSEEDAILRPGDAMARFVATLVSPPAI